MKVMVRNMALLKQHHTTPMGLKPIPMHTAPMRKYYRYYVVLYLDYFY